MGSSSVLDRYTRLTGRPALPPPWSFGLWLTTSFTTDYDEKTVTGFVDGMRERDLPLHVFHFDCFWMRAQHWCDFDWDPAAFPDPEGMLARLKAKGLHICVWINPYIAQRSRLFDEGMAKGYLLHRPDGRIWQWDNWQSGMASSISPTRRRARGTRATLNAWSPWASTVSRPISANASRPTSSITTGPILRRCTTIIRSSTTGSSLKR